MEARKRITGDHSPDFRVVGNAGADAGARLVKALGGRTLDVLFNNPGVFGNKVLGPLRVTEALLPW